MMKATPMRAMRFTTPTSLATSPNRPGAWPLLVLFLAAIAGLLWNGPIAQPIAYHQFADARPLLGVPNVMDVLTNLPFLFVGLAGLWVLRGASRDAGAHSLSAWRGLYVAVALTFATSGYYHWAPDNAGLVLDRVTIALGCGFMLCAFMAERFDARWGRAPALVTSSVVAVASVAYWYATSLLGAGDLRPYLVVQLAPMLLVPLGLWLTRGKAASGALPAAAWLTPLVLYALAKGSETADHAVFHALGHISGHSIKHLLAAAAVAVFVVAHAWQRARVGLMRDAKARQ